jgi:hypothetical protein
VSVNPTGLSPGTYKGSITVSSLVAAGSPQTIPVTLTVAAANIQVNPGQLQFTHIVGNASPTAQTVSVTSAEGSVPVGVSVASGGNWLAATLSQSSTPASLFVLVNPTGLAVGNYSGSITISSTAASNSPLTLPVKLVVSLSPTVAVTPASLSFAAQAGGSAPPSQTLALGSSDTPFPFTVATTSTGNWLSASASGSAMPSTLIVSVNAASLAAGTYNGSIAVTATGASNSPLTIPVTLTVSPATLLTATPTSLSFAFQVGGATPTAKTIGLTTSDSTLV